jgi:hypothetical protein
MGTGANGLEQMRVFLLALPETERQRWVTLIDTGALNQTRAAIFTSLRNTLRGHRTIPTLPPIANGRRRPVSTERRVGS